MKTRFTAQATDDLNQIADYLRDRNAQAALRVRDARRACSNNSWKRKLVTRKYAYLVYYAVDEVTDELVVLSVKHPAQERGYADT